MRLFEVAYFVQFPNGTAGCGATIQPARNEAEARGLVSMLVNRLHGTTPQIAGCMELPLNETFLLNAPDADGLVYDMTITLTPREP